MKPSDAYLKCKRDILDVLNARIEQLEYESLDTYGTPDYFPSRDKIDELVYMRGVLRNVILADTRMDK